MEPISYLETGVLYCDDNLNRLGQFPGDCIDLIYLDPPFFSNRNYEVIWGDEAEVRSFEDRWEGGIEVYIAWMRDRVRQMHRILKDTGSIYLHCDWHASAHLRLMMDEIFDGGEFQNEVVWFYRGAGVSKKRWARRHDTILFYTKGRKDWTFNPDPVRDEYADATKERFGHYIGNVRGDADYGQQELHPGGKHPDDVWEISIVAPSAKARLGYPTQKPEALLERIILASSNPGDIVLDPFAGCGTTQVVAERLGRPWIGIDISPTAVNLMRRRILKATNGAADVKLVGMPIDEAALRELKPFEFQNWVIQAINGTHSPRKSGDMGIDGFSFMHNYPVQVKQSDSVGRGVVDSFETALERAGAEQGYIIGFSFTRGAREECARVHRAKGLDIRLVPVSELLEQEDVRTPQISDMFPEPPETFLDLPLPKARNRKARPTPEELIRSDELTRRGSTEQSVE